MIYTTGTIAINGNTVTGTGTNFSAPLSLIRVGCTLIAVGDPVQIFAITEIKSDTELSVTPAANPAIPAGTKFSILLSDSISVDGLAQDVAETLRYYQGKETEISEAIEFFQEFDFNALTAQINQVHTDSAQVSVDKATVQQYKTDSESAKSAAEAARDKAVLAQTAAETANTSAQASSTAAREFRDQAEEWARSVNVDNLPTLDRQNRFLKPQEFFAPHPGLNLTASGVSEFSLGRTVLIENDNGNALNFIYKMQDDDTGRYTIRLPKPGATAVMTIGLDGGLSPNGDSYNNGLSSSRDFSEGQQGWRAVGGQWSNGPSDSSLFGTLFTHAVQGLNVGPYSTNGADDHWFIQRFYDTSANIFTRTQTNANPWGNWYKVTTSAVSDERLKDIKGNLNVECALDNINRMEFKLFSFKNEKSESKQPVTRRGVISQQIRLIDKEYTTKVGGFYHLDQTPMLLDGLAAIKALRARDEANKARIAKLEGELEELKAAVAALTKS